MSDLYTIAVMFRGGQRQVNLIYQSKAAAEDAFAQILAPLDAMSRPALEDSYGSRLVIGHRDSAIEAVLFQHASRAQEAQIEIALLQARSQSKANTRALADPMIKPQGQIVPGGGFIGRV